MAVVLDAGALIAADRLDRSVGALLRVAQTERVPVRTSAAVIAQVWRHGALQPHLARLLAGVEVLALDGPAGRSVGELLRRSRTSDVVDGHLGLIVRAGDTVLTGDVDDIGTILDVLRVRATVHPV